MYIIPRNGSHQFYANRTDKLEHTHRQNCSLFFTSATMDEAIFAYKYQEINYHSTEINGRLGYAPKKWPKQIDTLNTYHTSTQTEA